MSFKDVKLVYFGSAGRAECTRLLLHAAGVKYEDIFVSKEDGTLEEYKKKAPYKLLPYLEVDGNILAESHSINRYLARELGYMGKTALEAHKIDEIQSLWETLLQTYARYFFFADTEEKKAEQLKKLSDGFVETQGFLEAQLKKTGTGFLVGDQLSLADIYVFEMHTRGILAERAGPLDNFPLLKANIEKTGNLPNIASYSTPKPQK